MKTCIKTLLALALGLFARTASAVTYELSGDENWCTRTDPFPDNVNLKGHNLTVAQLTGTCEITDSTANGGELRVNCTSDSVKPATVVLSGSLKLVKTGPGKLTWGGGTFVTTNPILVTNGVLKLGVTTENVFGNSGRIIVKEKGQFDLNTFGDGRKLYDSPVLNKTFELEGDGPDGTGALVSMSVNVGAGKHLSSVVLTGDATIGGSARIDLRSGSLDGNGHTLTVKNTEMLCFSGGILQNCRAVVMTGKGVLQPCANNSIATTVGEIVLQDGILANWASGSTATWAIQSPVRVGAGGGTTRNDSSGSFALRKPLTVADNGTLEWLSGTWCCGGVTNKSGSTIHATGYMWVATGAFVNDGLVEFAAKTGSETFSFGSPIDNSDPFNNTIPCRVINNGTIRASKGSFTFRTESIAEGTGAFEVTGGTAALDGNLTDFTGTIRLGGGTTSIARASDFAGSLVLKDGVLAAGTSLAGFTGTATIDVSDRSAPLSVDGKNWFTFAEGKTVYVDVGARKLADGEKILDWSVMPANADKIDFRVIANGFVLQVPPLVNAIGLYYPDASAITVAHWTGKAGDGDVGTAGNWACTNVAGQGVSDVLPTEVTTVYFTGANLPAITNGASFVAAVVNVNAALSSDCDWSGMSVPMSGVIDLKGRNLTVGQLTGTCEITDSTANGGELRVNCTSDSVKPATVTLSGSLKLVKTGPGKLTWGGGTFATTNPILVTNGVLKLDVTTLNVFGSSGKIIVKEKGQFDLNYYSGNGSKVDSPVFGKTFEIEGDGPDGTGVIVNTYEKDWSGRHFNSVVLTGDATIGGTAHIDFRSGSLDGDGHTLTVKNSKKLCFSGGILKNCRAVVLTEKGVLQPCANDSIATTVGEIVLLDGIFASWAPSGNDTWQVQVPVRVGAGGGTTRNDGSGYYALHKPLTVEDNGTLTWQAGPWCCGGVTNKTGSTIRVTGDLFVASCAFVNDGLVEFAANKSFSLGSPYDQLQDPYNNKIPCRVVNNGTIRSTAGTFTFRTQSLAEGSGAFEVTGGTANFAGSLADFTGTIRLGGGTTSIAKVSDFTGTLVLKDGVLAAGTSLAGFTGTATIDVSDRSAPFDVDARNWFTFAEGKTVYVDVGARKLADGEKVLAWSAMPANADKIDFRVIAGGFVLQVPPQINTTGLYYPDASAITVAHWTGKAGDGDINTALNWACTNVAGQGVSDALPTEMTTVYFAGANLPAITNGATFAAAVVNVSAALSSDCDWGGMSVPMSGVIDLKGHNLTVGQLTGTYEITDSTANGGELRVNCTSDSVKPETVVLSGSLKLVKTGAGTLTWGGGTFVTTNPILVTNGVLKLDVTAENVFGSSGRIVVKEKGQFDLNYVTGSGGNVNSPVVGKTFELEGDGPDGTGAFVNTSVNKTWVGRHLSSVILTGDATIGGSARIDLRSGSLDGHGHTLTVKNTQRLCFSGGILQNCRAVVLTEKGVLQPCANDSIATTVGEIVLLDGIFANWASGGANTWQVQVPVRVGTGGGTARSDAAYFALCKPLTVGDNGTLAWQAGPWCCGGVTNKSGSTIHVTGDMFVANGAFVNDGLVEFAANKFFALGSHRDDLQYPYNNTIPCRVVNNGTIRVSNGTLKFVAKSLAEGAGTFEVTGGTADFDGSLKDFTGTIRLGGGTTSIARASDFTGSLVLKDGVLAAGTSLAGFTGTATIDVSDRSAPLDVDSRNWFTFAEGKTVYVDVGDRELEYGDRLISWTTKPTGVRFAFPKEMEGRLAKDDEGIVYAKKMPLRIIIR